MAEYQLDVPKARSLGDLVGRTGVRSGELARSIDRELAAGVLPGGAVRTADELTEELNALARFLRAAADRVELVDRYPSLSSQPWYQTMIQDALNAEAELWATLGDDVGASVAVLEQAGRFLADEWRDLPLRADRKSLLELERRIESLVQYQDNPVVMAAFFEHLGVDGTLDVPTRLLAVMANHRAAASWTSDIWWDDDTTTLEHIIELQERALEVLGTGLGTASRSGRLDAAFPEQLADRAIDHGLGAWQLSNVLRYGEYADRFILTIAEIVDEYERTDGYPRMWAGRIHDATQYTLGIDQPTQYYDPMVGIFEALGRSPSAAQDFLYPDGASADGASSERAVYYIRERTWAHDRFNALGEMLDAAATTYRDPADPRAWLSAQIASDTVHLLATRAGKFKIGEAGKDSFGHLLANYIVDVEQASLNAIGTGPGVDPHDTPAWPWLVGLPPGAIFERSELQKVLSEVLTDDAALDQIVTAANAWNDHRITAVLDGFADGTFGSSAVTHTVTAAAYLDGYIVGAARDGWTAAGADADAKATRMISLLSDIVGVVPIPGGKFVTFIVNQGRNQGKTWLIGEVADNRSSAVGAAFDLKATTEDSLRINLVIALGEAGLLSDPAIHADHEGDPYPWFVNGEFRADIATSDEHFETFVESFVEQGRAGYSELFPDIQAAYTSGEGYGSGP